MQRVKCWDTHTLTNTPDMKSATMTKEQAIPSVMYPHLSTAQKCLGRALPNTHAVHMAKKTSLFRMTIKMANDTSSTEYTMTRSEKASSSIDQTLSG